MHGPGGFGGPPGGGHRGGGHHGGGPRGGFGPGGFGGPRGGFGGRPPGRPINVVPPTYTGGLSSGGQSTEYVDENGKSISEEKYLRLKFGTVKGSIMTVQLTTTGAMKEEMFKARCATADDLLKDKRITARESIKRKMDAVEIYYGYLKKIGYWTEEEYEQAMSEFAQKIGATYNAPSQSNQRRR